MHEQKLQFFFFIKKKSENAEEILRIAIYIYQLIKRQSWNLLVRSAGQAPSSVRSNTTMCDFGLPGRSRSKLKRSDVSSEPMSFVIIITNRTTIRLLDYNFIFMNLLNNSSCFSTYILKQSCFVGKRD